MPKNWKSTLVKGDATEGRQLFVELDRCEWPMMSKGRLSGAIGDDKRIGPELSHMAGCHTIEFFAESIVKRERGHR
jgi:hypothetical protein